MIRLAVYECSVGYTNSGTFTTLVCAMNHCKILGDSNAVVIGSKAQCAVTHLWDMTDLELNQAESQLV